MSFFIPESLIEIILSYVSSDVITNFILAHKDKIDWTDLVDNKTSPLGFILEYGREGLAREGNIDRLCRRNDIPIEFVRENINSIGWMTLCDNESIELSFLDENRWRFEDDNDYYDWPRHSQSFLLNTIREAKSRDVIRSCLMNPGLFSGPVENVENLVKTMKPGSAGVIIPGEKRISCSIEHMDISYYLSANTATPISFLRRHPDLINWTSFTDDGMGGRDEGISEFLEENLKDLPWKDISHNPYVPEIFLRRHTDKIIWLFIGSNTSLSSSFFEDYFNLITTEAWYGACNNKHIPYDLIVRGLGESDDILFLAYNIPVEHVIKRIEEDEILKEKLCTHAEISTLKTEKGGDSVDGEFSTEKGDEKKTHTPVEWNYLCSNLGFWIHLAEYELRPILQSVAWGLGKETGVEPQTLVSTDKSSSPISTSH